MTHQENYEGKPILKRNKYGVPVPLTEQVLEAGKPYLLDLKTGKISPDPQLHLVKTDELMAELANRGLGVFNLALGFEYRPAFYRLKEGKKLEFISVLAGEPPRDGDITKLTFLKVCAFWANGSTRYQCQQFHWDFLADPEEFQPITPSTHGTQER